MKPLSGRVVCVFGLPCSGKTTLIKALIASSKELMAYVSSGDIARKLSTDKEIAHMAKGNLFPFEEPLRKEIYDIVHKRRTSGAEVIFLDGFPRFDDQVMWLLENQFAGTVMEGCFIQVIGSDLHDRARGRMRNNQDDKQKLDLKIAEQAKKIEEMEKVIHRHGIPYYCIPNTDMEVAVKDMAKRIGIKK